AQGAGRFCMGAAWRGVRDGSEKFERVLEIVREVSQLGMEVCVTLGEIGPEEARKLKAAGVTAYNHNLDTSPEFYPEIVSTHTFQGPARHHRRCTAKRHVGLLQWNYRHGETETNRLRMMEVRDIFELVRLIAVTRIALPKARVRLAAGRTGFHAKVRRSAFSPARIRFFTVTSFSRRKIRRRTWMSLPCANSGCSLNEWRFPSRRPFARILDLDRHR